MHVTFRSGALRLEGILDLTQPQRGAAVICHPHPQYGGNMFNDVVHVVRDALSGAGYSTLRFNFRGVGESEGAYADGHGECDDAIAAAAFLLERSGASGLTLAGYSFGAGIAVQAFSRIPATQRLIAVAPPLAYFGLSNLIGRREPMLFVAGANDSFCPEARLQDETARLGSSVVRQILPGADHFFSGYQAELRQLVAGFATLGGAPASGDGGGV